MSSSPTTSTPNLSASSSTVDLSHYDPKVRNLLETGSVKFHIRTAGAKWECTIVDRNTQYVCCSHPSHLSKPLN
ncbi:uncharacterized protein PODANS_6_2740 [Podospora anserina S mat+]|uniref:Podospora anserina S mat+ genomic DNA chromosome 6, supercontig 2 n=1 Tax=Podospora anserina (strain S / ATCC MYA-4624 / DSM 980 / FGSC 10383) TaxID=515849 RepID=B2B2M0_PODAN|nr:uncharacterized protein PODANS_6_2740 [Podospora anserina S mat+]CAP71355.1 unnamed protein product [Podospora anserina S mat+]CDP30754.1 Putative protein of unknown function [Podospora anserina S mat+]